MLLIHSRISTESSWRLHTLGLLLLVLGWALGPVQVAAQDEPTASASSGEDAEVSDFGWPVELTAPGGTILIYQPQLEAFDGNKLESRAAVSVQSTGSEDRLFGAIWTSCRVETDFDDRTVTLLDVQVTAEKFPEVQDQSKLDGLGEFLETEIPKWDLVMSLDRLLTSLEAVEGEQEMALNLNNDPPEIYYSAEPAVLVLIDGDPIEAEFEGTDLRYVVNTAFMILYEPNSKSFFLKGGDHWYESADLAGSWELVEKLPGSIQPVADRVAEEEEALQEDSGTDDEVDGDDSDQGEAIVPKVVLSTKPAELIQVQGEPNFASVEGTNLLYLDNTESDVIMDIDAQAYYLLVSGRWYTSKSLSKGPWSFMPHDQLPASFAEIPSDSDLGSVRTSVAGTQEAQEAVLENSIPQTAVVDRKEAKLEVTYDGDPEFESCADGVAYARNTDKAVFLVDRDKTYYCCDDAVWFLSSGPNGPWTVATEVPQEMQELPPDCPHYNVKYVYIYDSTPEVVYVGYTPSYAGAYVWGGCVVWGTGYYYHPWYRHYYYPRPVTYGWGVHYNPYTGWGFSVGVGHGWMRVGIGWGSPYYGCWGAAGYRYGYRHGYRHGYHHGYNNGFRHGYAAGARAGYRQSQRPGQMPTNRNLYRDRSNGVKSTGRDVATRPSTRPGAGTRPATTDRPASGTRPAAGDRPTTTDRPNAGTRPATADRPTTNDRKTPDRTASRQNDVYTDRSGNVYRENNGNYEQRDKGGWSQTDRSRNNPQQQRQQQNLNRDRNARQRGSERTQNYQSNRPSNTNRGGSGNRGGGGSRGGGGRRR